LSGDLGWWLERERERTEIDDWSTVVVKGEWSCKNTKNVGYRGIIHCTSSKTGAYSVYLRKVWQQRFQRSLQSIDSGWGKLRVTYYGGAAHIRIFDRERYCIVVERKNNNYYRYERLAKPDKTERMTSVAKWIHDRMVIKWSNV